MADTEHPPKPAENANATGEVHGGASDAAAGHSAGHSAGDHNPLSAAHLIGHVKDTTYFELPRFLGGKWNIPQFRSSSQPIYTFHTGFKPLDDRIEPLELKVTKFMVIELIVAVLLVIAFSRLAGRLKRDGVAKGVWSNGLEAMIVFIRDQVARPAIGDHDADRFMPFLLTAFFFVLGCNLFGMLPWGGSPTGALATTGALALVTFATVVGSGMAKLGPIGFWLGQVPHMDLPTYQAVLLKPFILGIEVLGLCIKHFILAMRLLANLMAGHLVLAVLMAFIAATAGSVVVWAVAPVSVLGAVALSMLELFVAFLQAYIFAFLSALFIGMAVHPH
jgi:F-type H+-transporting ATPase subunit a